LLSRHLGTRNDRVTSLADPGSVRAYVVRATYSDAGEEATHTAQQVNSAKGSNQPKKDAKQRAKTQVQRRRRHTEHRERLNIGQEKVLISGG